MTHNPPYPQSPGNNYGFLAELSHVLLKAALRLISPYRKSKK